MREFPEPFTASRWRRSTHHEARCGAPATLRSLELGCPVNAECGHLHSPRHHSNSPELPFGARTEEPAKLQRVSSVARCVDLSPRAGRRILEPARSRDPRTIFPLAPQRGERAGVRGHQCRAQARAVAATSFELPLTARVCAPFSACSAKGSTAEHEQVWQHKRQVASNAPRQNREAASQAVWSKREAMLGTGPKTHAPKLNPR